MATDYVLGLLSLYLAYLMLRRGVPNSRRYWVGALAACGFAALAGGTHHGFLPYLDEPVAVALWKATLLAIGGAALGAGMATIRTHVRATAHRPLAWALWLQAAVYAVCVMLTDDFVIAIIDYSLVFLCVFAVHLAAWFRTRETAAMWVVAGVLTSFVGAGIQAAGLAPHTHFNHNDLYHVIQMLGTWMLYRGASRTTAELSA